MRKQRRWARGSKRHELVKYYNACKEYLTDDMMSAINAEDVETLGHLVYKMVINNPDGTVARWEPGYEKVLSFYMAFEEYVEMKNKNVKTEDIIKDLEQHAKMTLYHR